MTKENNFNIKKVAIIGGGVSGISALYELLHTNYKGQYTKEPSTDPAFTDITLFERNEELGGNWHYNTESDPKFFSQELLNTGKYNDPDIVDPILSSIPSDKLLDKTNVHKPLTLPHDNTLRWSNSAAYPGLFSNIIGPLVRLPNSINKYDHESFNERLIHPFSTAGEIQNDLLTFVKDNGLKKFIKFNSTVERVRKVDDKWEVVIREYNSKEGVDLWYKETYDGIITANGHYSVPFVPFLEGLDEYSKLHPDSVYHTKSIKEFTKFKDKDVLIVGTHASSADVIKYLVGNVKSLTVSRRSYAKDPRIGGIQVIFDQPEIITESTISKFSDGSVHFNDGSIEKFDKIIFATGYHFHYPFLEDKELIKLGKIKDSNSKYSLIESLYLYTFSLKDPTFTTIGTQQSPYLWATFEAQAAAISGVWSNYSKLPSKKYQADWITQRNDEGVYHIYNVDTSKEKLADPLIELAPENRIHPFDIIDIDREHVVDGWAHALRIYKLFKNGDLSYDSVRKLDTSKKATSFEPEEIVYLT